MSHEVLKNFENFLSLKFSLNEIIIYIQTNNIIMGMDVLRILTKYERSDFISYFKENNIKFKHNFTNNFFLFL
jgi:hypothetical protein